MGQVLGHQRGDEWKQGDAEEKQPVDPYEGWTNDVDPLKQLVVADPGSVEGAEAEQQGEIGRPAFAEGLPQLPFASHALQGRNVNFQHEQGDGDGEHAVTERFQPPWVLEEGGHRWLLLRAEFGLHQSPTPLMPRPGTTARDVTIPSP